MNQCKNCKSELIENGVHSEAPDYKKWECPICDHKRVLIAAPIGGQKQYSINLWFDWIAKQSYPKELIKPCICVNGEGFRELGEKVRQVEISYPDGFKHVVEVLELPDSNNLTTIQKITYARETIRRFAVKEGYDYILFLDTDTIPANKDAIQQLIKWDKEAISGLYFYKNSKQPVVIDAETHTNISLEKCETAVKENKIIEVWGFGFGCLLLSRRAFEKNAFDYDLFGEERTDDFGYCHVLEQNGVLRYLDPFILCKHFDDPDKIKSAGTQIPFYIS